MIIDLDKVEKNARIISKMAIANGIEVTGVNKATCGNPLVAKAMLAGGVTSIGDSRIENIKSMKRSGVNSTFMLLRSPMISDAISVVENTDISLNTELDVLRELSKYAVKVKKEHSVILMVEMGDLREGILPDDLLDVTGEVLKMDSIKLLGFGMNLACFGGVVPTSDKVREFTQIVKGIEEETGFKAEVISGGNSSNIPLLLSEGDHSIINNLRIGEAILLGLETVNRTVIPGAERDAFVLQAELIEVKRKPSVPSGRISQNAFGETPEFDDIGTITRGIVGLGRQDVIVEDLEPLDTGVEILGSSSDHIILKLGEGHYKVGDIMEFRLSYGALVHSFTSIYVNKQYT
ncbi:MAG: alanine/ornithine racemase family PLP-dependent enzyme [Candidatus Thermoplasmatota archaeon]|nr:alanine/ornithine racemase family PLP-dependent enzyme [Candidatus Thermoplasmatota archaeon]